MQETMTVEPEEVSPVEKEPTEVALQRVLEQEAQWQQAEAEVLAEKERIQAEKDELHHRLAVGLVDDLFESLVEFAAEFTEGVIFKRYERIQAHVAKIREHDSAFPRTLSEAKYEVDLESFDFWVNVLEKWIAPGESLEKFMRGVFGTRTHGTPFSND